MRKIVESILLIVVLCATIFVLSGCEKKSEEGAIESATEKTSIVGSWKNDDLGSDFIYTFNEDGTGKYDAAGTLMEFTYTTQDGRISILYTGDTIPFETDYSVDGDVLNIIDSIGNDTLYERVK